MDHNYVWGYENSLCKLFSETKSSFWAVCIILKMIILFWFSLLLYYNIHDIKHETPLIVHDQKWLKIARVRGQWRQVDLMRARNTQVFRPAKDSFFLSFTSVLAIYHMCRYKICSGEMLIKVLKAEEFELCCKMLLRKIL